MIQITIYLRRLQNLNTWRMDWQQKAVTKGAHVMVTVMRNSCHLLCLTVPDTGLHEHIVSAPHNHLANTKPLLQRGTLRLRNKSSATVRDPWSAIKQRCQPSFVCVCVCQRHTHSPDTGTERGESTPIGNGHAVTLSPLLHPPFGILALIHTCPVCFSNHWVWHWNYTAESSYINLQAMGTARS